MLGGREQLHASERGTAGARARGFDPAGRADDERRSVMSRSAIACACTIALMSCSGPGDGDPMGVSTSAIEAQSERGVRVRNQAESARIVMSFGTMYGVDGPFVASTAIRGIPGDELPWSVERVDGSLDANGHLKLDIKGLVFSDVPSVPSSLRGINDEAKFRALVSCIAEGEGDKIETVNVITAGFQATEVGDSHIDTMVSLPKNCIAPIVFVMAGTETKWFAVTGVESGE
jgi:hypothetical protein